MNYKNTNIYYFIVFILLTVSFTQSSAPTLLSPVNNQEVNSELELSWSPVAGTLAYTIWVYDISTLEEPLSIQVVCESTGTGTSHEVFGLLPNKRYKWYVDAYYNTTGGYYRSSSFEFFTKSPTRTNGNGMGRTDVGIWYQPFGVADSDNEFKSLASDGIYKHHPLNTNNEFDYHISKLADIKVDFIIFDNTNGGFDATVDNTPDSAGLLDNYNTSSQTQGYVTNSTNMCQRIVQNWNDKNLWKIKYAHAIGIWQFQDATVIPNKFYYLKNKNSPSGKNSSFGDCINTQAHTIWDKFVNNSRIGNSDNYYHLDSKPLLILYSGVDLGNLLTKWYIYAQSSDYKTSFVKNFTVRFATNGDKGTYGWHTWGKGGAPPDKNTVGTVIDKEVEIVSPGSHVVGGPCKYDECVVLREHGRYYFEKCWKRVFDNPRPRIISIVSFMDNDERTAIWPSEKTTSCTGDDCDWTNESGTVDNHMYWNITKQYIIRLRFPVTPAILSPLLLN